MASAAAGSRTAGSPSSAGLAGAPAAPRASPATQTDGATGTTAHARDDVDDVDADGFRTVRGSAWRRRKAATAPEQGTDATARRDLGDDGETADAERAGAADEAAPQGGEEPGAQDPPPTADDLHAAWLEEVAVVRKLRQQGLAVDHPAMAAASKARDHAEALWRGAKDPAPISVRLSRAQTRLDRAVEIQAASRRAILDLERTHKARLAELQGKLDEDTERVRLRRRQLGEIQDEVASGRHGGDRATTMHGKAVQQVHTTLRGTVAPTISALVDQLDTSTPAWSILNGLLGTLSSSQALLEEAIAGKPVAQSYDIGDDAQGGGDADGAGDDHDGRSSSEWSESHELRDVRGGGSSTRGWHGDGDDGWGGRDDADQPMGSGEWWDMPRSDWEAGVRWQSCGHGKWTRSRTTWADSWEDERAQEQEDAEQPAAARRRLEPARPPQGAAADGAGGGAELGPAHAAAKQGQQGEYVQSVIAAAIAAGVQPLTATGEDLQMLDANQLAAWAAENLPADLQR